MGKTFKIVKGIYVIEMADSLTYKGGTHVVNHTGTDLKLVRPARGRSTHRVPQWWSKKPTVVYIEAAIFKVRINDTDCLLVVPTERINELKIRYDGAGNFTFPQARNIDRVALFNSSFDLLIEYQFSPISGGPVLKRTVAGLPVVEQSVTFDTPPTTISGTATVGQVLTATAPAYTGGKGSVSTNLIFQVSDTGSGGWTFLTGNPDTPSGGTATYTIQTGDSGKYIRASYQVTDNEATHSSNSGGTGPISATFATRVSNADYSYVVTVVNTGTEESPVNVYALNGVNQQAVTMSANETVAFDFSGVASAHPLGIFTDATKTTPVTVGVETGGTGNATLLFQPPIAGSFSYQCINHANMGGDITVS